MATDPSAADRRRSAIIERHREAAAEVVSRSEESLYVGGEWVEAEGGETFPTVDPTTGERLATVQSGTAADVDRAVEAAWRAYDREWSDASPADRQRVLSGIADRIEASAEAFATLDSLDNGKPITEARTDVELAADHFRYFAGAARFVEGSTVPMGGDLQTETIREPYGVVGAITPWNFPLLMAAWKLAPALAAGNCVVLKPAEETPLSVLELLRETEDLLPDGVVNAVTGYGTSAGAPLVAHEDVRKVAFTGSTEVGRGVMKSAADTITDVTLELGGKSPVVIFPDADVDRAVDVALDAMFYNAGECCSAGTRLFVHSGIREPFLERFVAAAEALAVGDPLVEATDVGPKVSQAQVNRTEQYVRLAREAGGEILTGGGRPDGEALADGCFVEPTVIAGLDNDARPAQEEIFGPVELVFEWEDYGGMIERANDVDYGLAAGVVTDDLSRARRAVSDLEVGTVWVNTYNEFPAGQPFGGYERSGTGRETARETIDEYTRTKTITTARS